MIECGVCFAYLNDKQILKQVKCPYCDANCCQVCFKKYLLMVTEQNCMNCKSILSDKFIETMLPKAFIDDKLTPHKKEVFIMQEKERLKLYEYLVPKYKRQKHDIQLMKKFSNEIRKLEFEHKKGKHSQQTLDAKKATLNTKIQKIILDGFHLSKDHIKIKRTVISGPKCPLASCKGHTILHDGNYLCQLCEKQVCKNCLTEIAKNHECNESDVLSLKLIMEDSKSCPGCGIMIFRSSGCPAMFCTNCNVSFNWNTLEIEEPSHNPHYYEWVNSKATDYEFLEMGEEDLLLADKSNMPEYELFSSLIPNYDTDMHLIACSIHRLGMEIGDLLNSAISNNESDTELLRVQYLSNEIVEDKFMKKIEILQKEADYYDHQRNSIGTVYRLITDKCWELICKIVSIEDFVETMIKLFDKYAKDQVETAIHYNKLCTQSNRTYGSYHKIKIKYIVHDELLQRIRGKTKKSKF